MSTAADMVTVVDRNTIAFERRFPDKIERVWSAITVKDEIGQWFMKTEIDLRVGGAGFGKKEKTAHDKCVGVRDRSSLVK